MKWLLIALLFALPASAAAQAPGDSALIRALGEFRPGQPIRVALLRSRWVGDFERVAGDTLYFGTAGQQPMAIRFNAIDTLWRQTSAKDRGSVIGGVTLGLVLGAVGVFAGSDEGGDAGQVVQGALIGGFLGAGIGSVVGGFVGSRSRLWIRVYP